MFTHTYREQERMHVRMCVFVFHVSKLCVSSAGLIVAVQKLPACQNSRNSLMSVPGWETCMYSVCVAVSRDQRCETHEADSAQSTSMWLKIDIQHRISEAVNSLSQSHCLFAGCVGKRVGGGSLWLEELNKDCVGVKVSHWSFLFLCLALSTFTQKCLIGVMNM